MDKSTENKEGFDALLSQIEKEKKKEQRNEKIKIGFLSFMILFCVAYMTWIYSSIGILNAEELSRQGGDWVEGNVPEWQADLKQKALDQAPAVIDEGKKMLLAAPEKARNTIENNLLKNSEQSIDKMRKKLNTYLAKSMQDQIKKLNEKQPVEVTNDQKLEMAMEHTIKTLKGEAKSYLDSHSHEFSKQLEDLKVDLERLRTAEELSEKDKLKKEIIQVCVVLVNRHHKLDTQELALNK